MATLDDLPRMLDEDPAIREDLVSCLVAFCARRGIDVSSDDLIGRNITDDAVSGYIFSATPDRVQPAIEDLPEMLAGEPAVRDDLISTLVAFCGRHSVEAAPEELVGLTDGDEVSGYGGYSGIYLGRLEPLRMSLPIPQPQNPPVITIQIQIL